MKIPDSLNWSSLASDDVIHSAEIVLIDDEPACVEMVRFHLQSAGYTKITTTTDGLVGRELILKQQPDIVLLDVVMPTLSGLDVLQAVRANLSTAHTPVVVFTGSTDADIKAEALNRGATDFITKPIDPIELIPRVRNALAAKAYQDQLKLHADVMDAYADQVMSQQQATE